MSVAEMTTARLRVEDEKNRLAAILARRGGLYEDERVRLEAMNDVLAWMDDEQREAKQAAIEAKKEEEAAEEQARLNDPNYKTKELFGSYRAKLKQEGRMR